MFDTASIDIPCPGCGHETSQKVAWLKTHDEFTCAGCGSTVRVDAKQFRTGLKTVEKSLADFQRQLRKLGK